MDDLTPEQVNALRLVDNKSNESEWDFDLLAKEFDEVDMSAFDFDWATDAFEDAELERMMADEVEARKREVHRVTIDCRDEQETLSVAELLRESGYKPKIQNS